MCVVVPKKSKRVVSARSLNVDQKDGVFDLSKYRFVHSGSFTTEIDGRICL